MLWTGRAGAWLGTSRHLPNPAPGVATSQPTRQHAGPGARGLVKAASFWGLHDGDELSEERRPRRFTRRGSRSRREAALGGHQQHHPQTQLEQQPEHTNVCTDDLVELCVGGTVMMTSRSTLAQIPGSVLHDMFSCRESDRLLPRSSRGEVFLDFEPYMFGLVLRFLRELKMGRGAVDHSLSSFRQEDRAHLLLMLRHLRLLPEQEQERTAAHGPAGKAQAAAAGGLQAALNSSCACESTTATARGAGRPSQAQASAHVPPAPGVSGQVQAQCAGRERSSCDGGAHKQLQEPAPKAQAHSSGRPAEGTVAGGSGSGSSDSSSSGGSGRAKAKAAGGSGAAAAGWGAVQEPVRLVAPPVPRPVCTSQLYYVQAQYEERRGIRISVYTESDLNSLSASEHFGIFCDATASEGQLSFTFVCRQEFDNMFVGITTRNHTDCKGSQVPSFGWKRTGCIYSAAERATDPQSCPLPAPGTSKEARGAAEGGKPLWRKGDSVELIVSLGDAINQPRMVLKVNGQQLDHIAHLPPLHSWSWYMALYMGSDTSSVAFTSDSYAVFWGQYQVKRFLS